MTSSAGTKYTENVERAQLTNMAIALAQNQNALPTTQAHQTHQNVNSLAEAYIETSKIPESRKLFVRSIAENVTDSAIESLLIECGPINYFRRSKNERGDPVSFGTVEFRDVEGILNCIRLLQRFNVMGKKLEISMGERAKVLIAEYIAYRKADLALRLSGRDISEAEIDHIIAEEFSIKDAEIQSKLERIAQAFGENREKILKTNTKTGVVAITEEKLNLYKHKFGLMNNKELNESFYRDLEKWLKKEEEYEQKRKAEEEAMRDLHKRKMELIEKEIDGQEEEYLPKNENHEKFLKRKKQRRIKILKSDIEYLRENNMKIDIELKFDKDRQLEKRPTIMSEDKEDIRNARDLEAELPKAAKKIKQEVIPMQPVGGSSRFTSGEQEKKIDQTVSGAEKISEIHLPTIQLFPSAEERGDKIKPKNLPVVSLGSLNDLGSAPQHSEEHKQTFATQLKGIADEDLEEEELARLYNKKHRPLHIVPQEQVEQIIKQQSQELKTREELKLALYK